ncbi:MAG: TenA family protein [Bacteroidales bacterium]|nr:TenA family protein [Bacteroidales bacterium]
MTVEPDFEQILKCPYVGRLADGTLPHSWFAHYLSQDVLYLIDDSRALAITAARAYNPDEMYFFLQLAKDGLDIERALHNDFLKYFAIPEAHEKSPAFHAYTDFLLDHAFHAPYPVAVTALLPCFWVYFNTGVYIFNNTVSDNPYQKWIDTYSGAEYMEYTQRFIGITENIGQKAESKISKQMIDTFAEGTKHEFMTLEEAAHH